MFISLKELSLIITFGIDFSLYIFHIIWKVKQLIHILINDFCLICIKTKA